MSIMRDTIKDECYFDAFIQKEYDRIFMFQDSLSSGTVHPNSIERVKATIHDIKLGIIIAKYSRGDSISSIQADFNTVWNDWESVYSETFYSKALRLFSLGVLFNIEKSELIRMGDVFFQQEEYDWLIKYLSNCDRDTGKNLSEDLSFPKQYRLLRDMVIEGTVNADNIKGYLSKWYQRQAGAGWYNAHKSRENLYYGYWSFEAGAIAKIHGIDDEILRGRKYYPYDLVHF